MKPISNLLHNTPWWLLLTTGVALLLGLAMFAAPLSLMHLQRKGATPAEKQAINAEIDSAVTDSALNIGRGVLREMLSHTKDPARREEIEDALREIDAAHETAQEAGKEVLRAKRQAASDVADAIKEAQRAIADARRQTQRALKDAGVDNKKALKSLNKSLAAAEDAGKAVDDMPPPPETSAPAIPAPDASAAPKGPKLPDMKLAGPGGKPIVIVQVDTDPPAVRPGAAAAGAAQGNPEERDGQFLSHGRGRRPHPHLHPAACPHHRLEVLHRSIARLAGRRRDRRSARRNTTA